MYIYTRGLSAIVERSRDVVCSLLQITTLIWHTLSVHCPICGSTPSLMPSQEIPESVFVSMQLMHGFWTSQPPLPLTPKIENSILLPTYTSTENFEPSSIPHPTSLSYKILSFLDPCELLTSLCPCKLRRPRLRWSTHRSNIHTFVSSYSPVSSNPHPFSNNDSRDPDSTGNHGSKLLSAIYY